MAAILIVLAGLALLFPGAANGQAQVCPYQWILGPDQTLCYYFGSLYYIYNDALTRCQATSGATLVQFNSTAQWNWIMQQINTIHSAFPSRPLTYWTDMSRPFGQNWQYSDGTPVQMQNLQWAPGQPPLDTNPYFVYINGASKLAQTTQNNQWNGVICQRQRGLPLLCARDQGWHQVGSRCVKMFNVTRTWSEAERICQSEGAHLATVYDQDTQGMIFDQANEAGKNTWIGLKNVAVSGKHAWLWANGNQTLNSSNTYWFPGNPPNNILSFLFSSFCVSVTYNAQRLHSWKAIQCSNPQAFVCSKPQGICAPGWAQYQTHCYQFNPRFQLTWTQASTFCQNQGGKLLQLNSLSDQGFINLNLRQQKLAGVQFLWTGLTDDVTGQFKWTDGTALAGYTNWAAGVSLTNNGQKDCVYIPTSDASGTWIRTTDCTTPRSFVCQMNAGDPLKAVATPPPSYMCADKNWIVQGANCYRFVANKLTWPAARIDCQNQNADLVRIDTDQLQGFINSHLSGGDYWIGLNDRRNENQFVWLDDANPTTYKHWNTGEPNNAGNENCVVIFGTRGPAENGKWNDFDCNNQVSYVCQTPALNAPIPQAANVTSRPVWSQKCGAFWDENPNTDYCYQFSDTQLTWTDAQTVCQARGGNLVSIVNGQELAYITGRIKGMTSTALWTGANDRSTEGGWRWLDEQPFAFLNWNPGEPNDSGNNEDCGTMITNTAQWNDAACNNRNGFICKKLGTRTHTTNPPTTSPRTVPAGSFYGCRPGWLGYRNQCYYFVRISIAWREARDECRKLGSELASVADAPENDFIKANIPKSTSQDGIWFGINDRDSEMQFQWTDGSPVTYTNWAVKEPNAFPGLNEDCGEFYLGGTWNDNDCDRTRPGYVCKAPKSILLGASSNAQSLGCPAGSLPYQALCYTLFFSTPASWQDAEKSCTQIQGHLATVNDRFVQAFLSAELALKNQAYWIGLADINSPGKYSWTSQVSLQYTNWDSTHRGTETRTCVVMRPDHPVGLWMNKDCSQKSPYICESPRTGYTTPLPTSPAPTPNPLYCYSSWTEYNGYCYRAFTNVKRSWGDARAYCQTFKGGDLASIGDKATETFLKANALMSVNAILWIGLNDRDREKSFTWPDRTPYSYQHWNPGEPNDFNSHEDCAELSTSTMSWNDNNCALSNAFFCKAPKSATSPNLAIQPTALPTMAIPVNCTDSRFQLYKGWCYSLSPLGGSDAFVTWFEARRKCASMGANLLSVHSPDENDFVLQMTSLRPVRTYWIGLNELDRKGYRWSDGTPVQTILWAMNEPNDAFGGEKCVDMYSANGNWNDDNCMNSNAYVCRKSNTAGNAPINPTPTTIIPGGCPPTFYAIGNKCYYISGDDAGNLRNWTVARDTCRKMGALVDIATISSGVEQAFLTSLLTNRTHHVWIGLNDLNFNLHFVWQDNSEVTYTNWANGQPSDNAFMQQNQREDCVSMATGFRDAGQWSDDHCNVAAGYVCQTMKNGQYPISNPPPSSCPSGYSAYGSACYSVQTTPATWSNAQTACGQNGGNLVSIANIYEHGFVWVLISNAKINSDVWIGLSDSQVPGVYAWSDGWPVFFTRWADGEPSRLSTDDCVKQQTNGRWNDTNCQLALPYVCKKSSATPPSFTAGPGGFCRNPLATQQGMFCYYANPYVTLSWPEASYACRQLGMELASVFSKAENDFLQNLAATAPIPTASSQGIRPRLNNIWLGLNKGLNSGFGWVNQAPVGYLNWNKGEPNDADKTMHENCAEMYTNGFWNDVDCFQKKGYACRSRLDYKRSTFTPYTTVSTQPTPAGNQPTPFPLTQGPQGPVPTGNPATQLPIQRSTLFPPGQFMTNRWNGGRTINPLSQVASTGTKSVNMSAGEIVGVLIAVLVVVAVVAGLLIVYKRQVKAKLPISFIPQTYNDGYDNALYKKDDEKVDVQTVASSSRTPFGRLSENVVSLGKGPGNSNDEDC